MALDCISVLSSDLIPVGRVTVKSSELEAPCLKVPLVAVTDAKRIMDGIPPHTTGVIGLGELVVLKGGTVYFTSPDGQHWLSIPNGKWIFGRGGGTHIQHASYTDSHRPTKEYLHHVSRGHFNLKVGGEGEERVVELTTRRTLTGLWVLPPEAAEGLKNRMFEAQQKDNPLAHAAFPDLRVRHSSILDATRFSGETSPEDLTALQSKIEPPQVRSGRFQAPSSRK